MQLVSSVLQLFMFISVTNIEHNICMNFDHKKEKLKITYAWMNYNKNHQNVKRHGLKMKENVTQKTWRKSEQLNCVLGGISHFKTINT